ncbi:uncharacterized protein BDR25DRAFT_284171 [Lindgomyces ingoldianus]|uniref:Uncharacterized protein n=1 Tax=Lindgomyces ingoldianus TaxID=673940 RepID=A0ACB6R0B6_9PLEO|nr:uncharacterized protein BDR25DRAFT_284171 [Lindgomyces ingoldianus]KAF2472621.1 hypothetical protein BDR25DRAFT_284171 [Lindgomyces ingoldianus]
MPSRYRKSTVRPNPGRASIAPALNPCNAALPNTQLPTYRKPSHPLNHRAQNQLASLTHLHSLKDLKNQNQQAVELITQSAGAINDMLRERELRVAKRRQRWERDSEGVYEEEQEREERELEDLKAKVENMTKELEVGMRHLIDTEMAGSRIEEGFQWMRTNAPGLLEQEYVTQVTQQQTQQSQNHTQRQRRQTYGDGDEEMNDTEEGEDEEIPSPGPTPLSGMRIALTGPSELFADRLQKMKENYLSLSHTVRYAKNNDYIGFKSMVHDAKNGDNGPPLPHADTWFTERGSPAPGITATQNGADEDDDLVVDKATISTRCPITFQKFQEPVSSKKCPHSFEKHAILDFIRRSNVKIGGGPGRGQGEKAVQCPVSGCSQMITASDLFHDAVLIRKIKRMQQAEAQEDDAEDSDLEDNPAPRRHRQEGSGEDDVAVRPSRRVKSEVAVPATQESPRRTAEAVDLGDPSDFDDSEHYG